MVQIGRGYLHNVSPGKFIPDPRQTKEDTVLNRGMRAYRTGDRVVWRGGMLTYVGRGDKQTKVSEHN